MGEERVARCAGAASGRGHGHRLYRILPVCFVSLCLRVFVFVLPCALAAPAPRPAAAGKAAKELRQKGILPGAFHPEQYVTRGELAIVLVRMIDYLEGQGPRKISQSKSPPLVSPRVLKGLAQLPHHHPAYPALLRLAKGGYLLPSNHGELFLPTRQNLDRPVTARELSAALAGVASRIEEKKAALEHPGVIEDQRESVTSPGQHRGTATGPP